MKADELRPCDLCGKGLMQSGIPLFYRVTIERMAFDVGAVRERVGLSMLVGPLAEVFASRSQIAHPVHPDADFKVLICEPCSLKVDAECIARLHEIAQQRRFPHDE